MHMPKTYVRATHTGQALLKCHWGALSFLWPETPNITCAVTSLGLPEAAARSAQGFDSAGATWGNLP